MKMPALFVFYVTHLCLTGKPHSSRLEAKGVKKKKEKKKGRKKKREEVAYYYKALHTH